MSARGRGTAMLRFASDADLLRDREARRERFQRGQTHVPERDILAACIELLRVHPAVAFAVRANCGAGYLLYADTYKRLVACGALKPSEARFMRFGVKGQGDITGMLKGGRRLEVECKADRGVVSDDQIAFAEGVNGGGGLALVVRSVDELIAGLP